MELIQAIPLSAALVLVAVGGLGFWISSLLSRGTLTQTGPLRLTGNMVSEVRYPIPYASAPNLTFDGTVWSKELTQDPDGFRLVHDGTSNSLRGCSWTAIGIVDSERDPRSFLNRMSWGEALFAIVGFVGSLASILSLFQS